MKTTHNKLVRDNIISIIMDNCNKRGWFGTAEWQKLSHDEFKAALKDKLSEEVAEFLAAADKKQQIEEMADIIEVIFSIICEFNLGIEEVLKKRKDKHREKGGFDKRTYLISVEVTEQ